MDELVELHRRLMALRERHILQQVINEEHVLSEVSFSKSLTPAQTVARRDLCTRRSAVFFQHVMTFMSEHEKGHLKIPSRCPRKLSALLKTLETCKV